MSQLRPQPVLRSPTVTSCRVFFGAPEMVAAHGDAALSIPLQALEGPARDELLAGCAGPFAVENCTVFRGAATSAGFSRTDATADLELATRELYRRVFAATRGQHLYRIWNYVPRINQVEAGLENYRRFCRGRSLAFEEKFGRTFERQLPAASAVGTTTGPLAIAFLAGEVEPQHFENPQQVPAFEYPADYGPRPPSFSRATRVQTATKKQIFVSGTAAIRGHLTVAADDLMRQLACTHENLDLIAEAAGAGPRFGTAQGWHRSVKVYVRHAAEFPVVREYLRRELLQPADEILYLHADLCRADLRVEIEAVLTEREKTAAG